MFSALTDLKAVDRHASTIAATSPMGVAYDTEEHHEAVAACLKKRRLVFKGY